MAEDTVVKEVLTHEMADAGEELVRELDRRNWSVEDALWLYESDTNRWQLVIASPNLEQDGPRRCYEVIRNALDSLPRAKHAIGFFDVSVRSPSDPLINVIGQTLKTGPTVNRIRLNGTAIDGHLVEDGLVYRSS